MIGLFARGVEHEFADFRVAGEQRLGVVQGLGGHLAGMVHAHQGRGFPLFISGKRGIGLAVREAGGGVRHGPAGGRGCEQGTQRAVGCRNQGDPGSGRWPWGAIIGPESEVPNPLGHQEFCKGLFCKDGGP